VRQGRLPHCRAGSDTSAGQVPQWKGARASWAANSDVLCLRMILRLIRILALLVAASFAPSLAYAHAGHGHSHAPVAQDVPAAASHGQGQMVAVAVVKTALASAARSADPAMAGCASHCCSGVTGMPCCGAVLVPEIVAAPDLTTSRLVRFGRADALQGLPPKALPKPPKLLG